MNQNDILHSLGWIVTGAALCVLAAKLVRLPGIVACIFAGLILGPLTGVLEESEGVHLISEMGIVLLLFLVGLELSAEKFRDVGKVAAVAGSAQVVITIALGFGLSAGLGFGWVESLFLAFAMTISSTVVAVKLLCDKNEMGATYGKIAVGNLLVQDIVVILGMTVLSGLGGSGGGKPADGWSVFLGVLRSSGGMGLLLVSVLLASKYLLPRMFGWISSSAATIFIWSLSWCLAVVSFSYFLGLSMEMGAFFSGISLAQLPYSHDLQHRIKPLMNFFVAVFFVLLGAGMELGDAGDSAGSILLLCVFVLVGKPLVLMLVVSRVGYGAKTAFLSGLTIGQISEFSFVFVAMGVSAGLVDAKILGIVSLVGVASIAVSSYLILYNGQIVGWLEKKLGFFSWFPSGKVLGEGAKEEKNHIIVVGMNTLGRSLAARLAGKGERVLALDTDPNKLRGLPCKTMVGSAEFLDVLYDAGLPGAKLLVSALSIEEANELLAFRCRQFGVPCAINAVDVSMADNLLDLEVGYLMLPKVDGVKLQNRYLKESGVLAK